MALTFKTMIAVILAFAIMLSAYAGTAFYINPEDGSDDSDGFSQQTAWRSCANVSKRTFGPGDQILIRAGMRVVGRLSLKGSGTAEDPIIVGSYGEGCKPEIAGMGSVGKTVVLRNGSHWRIKNLEITNYSEKSGKRSGLVILTDSGGAARDIVLEDLHVHHVSGGIERNGGEGIFFYASPSKKGEPSWFEDVLVEGCHIHDVPFNGLLLSGWLMRQRNEEAKLHAPSRNVVIRGNLLHDVAGDAICIINAAGVLIENNEVIRACAGQKKGAKTPSAGIWPHSTDDCVMRYNRVSGLRGIKDGQAFDIDMNCHRTIVENNFSMDNEGGFLLVCSVAEQGDTLHSVIRNNLSISDGTRLFTMTGSVRGVVISNNVLLCDRAGELLHSAFWMKDWAENIRFYSNIFIMKRETKFARGESIDIFFSNNILMEITLCVMDGQRIKVQLRKIWI